MRTQRSALVVGIVTLSCTFLLVLFASLVSAKPKQPTDQDICSGKQTAVYGNCLNNGGSEDQCWKASLRRYNQCMQARGYAPGTYAPIVASPTPKPGRSVNPIAGGAINKATSQPSPTPSAPPHHQKRGKS